MHFSWTGWLRRSPSARSVRADVTPGQAQAGPADLRAVVVMHAACTACFRESTGRHEWSAWARSRRDGRGRKRNGRSGRRIGKAVTRFSLSGHQRLKDWRRAGRCATSGSHSRLLRPLITRACDWPRHLLNRPRPRPGEPLFQPDPRGLDHLPPALTLAQDGLLRLVRPVGGDGLEPGGDHLLHDVGIGQRAVEARHSAP